MKDKGSANKPPAPVKRPTAGPASKGEMRSVADIAAYVAKVESVGAELMETLQRVKEIIRWTTVFSAAKGVIASAHVVEILAKIEFAVAENTKMLELAKKVSELPPDARACFDYLDRLGRATDPGSQILAGWLCNLEFEEARTIMPLLKPLAKKRGRPPGRSRSHAKIEDQAYLNVLSNAGCKQTLAAVTEEYARLGKPNPTQAEIQSIERDLRRARRRAKKG